MECENSSKSGHNFGRLEARIQDSRKSIPRSCVCSKKILREPLTMPLREPMQCRAFGKVSSLKSERNCDTRKASWCSGRDSQQPTAAFEPAINGSKGRYAKPGYTTGASTRKANS